MQERLKELENRAICKCSAYPFPHGAGELRMCVHHPSDHIEPTEEEWAEYEITLKAERGSTCRPRPPEDPLSTGLGIRRSQEARSDEPPF